VRSFPARLRSVIASDTAPEGGFSLIEVLIAMMVFAVLSVGVAYSLLSVLAMTKEGRARQMATNLAAQEIDLDRSAKDVFTLGDSTRTVTNADGSFVVKRTTQWVSGAGEGNGCGSGTGVLQYKRINVSVTWDGMRAGASPVRTDTQLAPKNLINDPALGTIIVATLAAGGAGSAGVSVSATPTAGVPGNTAVSVTGAATNAQGCSYLLKVVPGTYDVTVSRAGYIDNGQVPTSTKATNIAVTAGTSASAGFVFDLAGSFSVTYASNATAGTVQFPSNLDTTFLSTAGVYVSAATAAAASRTLQLFPFPGGYAVMAGKYVAPSQSSPGCISVDPEAWPEAPALTASTRTLSTTTTAAGLPMGLLTLSGAAGKFVTAVSATGTGAGDPGCTVPMTYTFDALATAGKIALPYGSWTLFTGSSKGAKTTALSASSIAVTAPSAVSATTGVATLDPRTVVAP
jgi:prepilin-type N-terminal cleavage/methylation domain-containing protein